MLEFVVDSDLYFVQDKNNFINPLLQEGSGSAAVEKSTGSGSGGPKINGSLSMLLRTKMDLISRKLMFNLIPVKNQILQTK